MRLFLAAWLALAPTVALAQATLSPRYKTLTITGTGSSGDVSGMSVTAGGSTRSLATWFPLLAPLASPTFTGTATIPTLAISSTGSTGAVDGMTVGGTALSTALPAKAPLASPVFTGTVGVPAYTVAGLPACAAAIRDTIAVASDATAPTYRGALTGGGTVRTLVYCDGTSWTAH